MIRSLLAVPFPFLAAFLTAGCCTCPPSAFGAPPPAPVTTEDTLSMTQAGQDPEVIIAEPRRSRTIYVVEAKSLFQKVSRAALRAPGGRMRGTY